MYLHKRVVAHALQCQLPKQKQQLQNGDFVLTTTSLSNVLVMPSLVSQVKQNNIMLSATAMTSMSNLILTLKGSGLAVSLIPASKTVCNIMLPGGPIVWLDFSTVDANVNI